MSGKRMNPLFNFTSEPSYFQFLDRLGEQEHIILQSYLESVSYIGGQSIVYEDQSGEAVFFIKEGEVEIFKLADLANREYIPFIVLEKGGMFGEMSLLTHLPASATAVARSEVKMDVLKKESFHRCREDHPQLAWKLYDFFCRTVIRRLYQTDQKVTELLQLFPRNVTDNYRPKKC
ncbi:MAG: Crp/Fnr family transcriptional regulator [bacterium]